jgi:MFS family permease
MTLEYSPQSRRGFFGSVVQVGTGLGLTLATGVLFIGSILPGDAFFVWGWRIPFLVSIVLLVVGLYIRLNLEETPAFRKVRQTGQVVRVPIAEVLRVWPKQVLATTALYLGGVTVPFYTVSVFLVYYSTSIVHIDRSAVLLGLVVNNAILLGSTVMGGVLADKIGHRSMFLTGLLLMAVLAFRVFWLTDLGTPKWFWVAMLMFGTPFWFTWGVVPAYFYEFFPAQVRYTGISVGSQSATIIGGLVAFFATALLPVAGTWPVSLLVIITSLISSLALVLTPKIGYAPPETLTP